MGEKRIYSLFCDLKGYYNIAIAWGKMSMKFHNDPKSGILNGVVTKIGKNPFYNIDSFRSVL